MMARTVRLLVMLFVLGLGGDVLAQGSLALARLEVGLWPEYDRADVLVIYRGTIAPGARLPAVVKLRIPAVAGAPNAVAEDRGEGLVSLAFDREIEGDWAEITFTATVPEIQVEYYDPGLQRIGASRSYTFQWPGDYAVGEMELTIQEPIGASSLATVPASTGQSSGGDGLLYYGIQLGGTREGETKDLQLTYEKSTDDLTVAVVPPAPAPPPVSTSAPATSVTGGQGISDLWMAAAAVLVVAAIAGAWVVAKRRAGALPPGLRSGPKSRGASARAGFCTKCGNPAGVADRFCHACGQPLVKG